MRTMIRRAVLRLGTGQLKTMRPALGLSLQQRQTSLFSALNASFIELLPKIDLSTPAQGQKQRATAETEEEETTTENSVELLQPEELQGAAILQISTFKRKKPKMRKDRARTIRRRIKRKSAKKRAKYNL